MNSYSCDKGEIKMKEHHHKHEECNCGHHHEHHHEHKEEMLEHIDKSVQQKVYIVENLGCANCAAKMERKINELPEVEAATLTFATRQLWVASNHQEELLPVLQEICSSIEREVIIKLMKDKPVQKHGMGHEQRKKIIEIGVSALVFLVAIVCKDIAIVPSIIAFFIAYFLLGRTILFTATKHLFKGHVFDENFLMSLATIAAFAIGDFAEAVGVMLFFRIGELFEEIAVEKSRNQIMEAVDMRPENVQIVHEYGIHSIPAEDAKVGDILLVRVGDRIPLDAVVLEGESRIDTAPVTGEPVPVKVEPGDMVVSGCINTSKVLKIRVEKTLENSMVTRILHSVEHAAASKPKLDRFITRFARIYTPVVVIVAMITAILPSLITGDWSKWIFFIIKTFSNILLVSTKVDIFLLFYYFFHFNIIIYFLEKKL